MKKIVSLFLFAFSLFLFIQFLNPLIVNAEDNTSKYLISSYDVDIKVNINNTFNIKETIGAYFKVERHGIFRKIPLRNTITRLDGTTTKNVAKISNIEVNNEYTTSNENGNKVLTIGNPDKTLTGNETYVISYLYNIGKDKSKDYDELYLNIIGNEWDTTIDNVTFSIEMPKEFDKTKIGFSSGRYGTIGTDDINYDVIDNKIIGTYKNVLDVEEGLTIRIELPDGYFVGASINLDNVTYLMIILPIVFVLLSILLWYKYGKDEQVIETVEFYPPAGYNSAEVAFLYKGRADSKDVVSLLIYLANKGYLKITETEQETFFSKNKGFKLTKIKEYDGDNINERTFFNDLFKSNKTEVDSKDLRNSFYTTITTIVTNLNCKENKKKIFEKSSLGKSVIVLVMIILTFLLITIKPMMEYGEDGLLPFAIIFPCMGFIFMAKSISANEKVVRIIGIIMGAFFAIVTWALIVLPALIFEIIYLIIYIIGIICSIIMAIASAYMLKRNKYGNEILGKIRGFKDFLELAEKPKLEELVNSDPSYFYNILPYTYVLGVSDKWIKKFETIAIEQPSWYESNTAFNVGVFGGFINSTMTSATRDMTYQESSSSGSGGFSGGGFSGGGSGGGGGGSW